ncbi:hypothetical protein H0H81_003621 [Sphagnurus paluster]|uniref:Uncharacterized protein n=1 Tax=Sphagnurus paluster TaxID=117069 RepID=A0A9P7GMJ3_9AGAR|nr:hypothetical protein H0H81_003621 [Sphagnurus paluster]
MTADPREDSKPKLTYHGEQLGPDSRLEVSPTEAELLLEEKKLVRKLDRRILPIACLLYLFAYLDRSNLGNARLQGLAEDILGGDKTGVLFDWINSVFFVSYAVWVNEVFEIDSLSNTSYGDLQAISSSEMDGVFRHWLGYLFHADGEKHKHSQDHFLLPFD